MSEKIKIQRLTDPHPDWETKYVELKTAQANHSIIQRIFIVLDHLIDKYTHPRSISTTEELINCAELIFNEDNLGSNCVVIGCGPNPTAIKELANLGYTVSGIEPIDEAIHEAKKYLTGTAAAIIKGTAEQIPLENNSQSLVLMENVLEHVDSASMSLREAYRILKPGGVLFIRTSNRYRFSITGVNWEYSTRFYNWFPRIVKESYVFSQLHYRPQLARYSSRPAVHWFNFPDLCDVGREAGFARFYSPFDLIYLTINENHSGYGFRISHWCRKQPWLRALIVSQMCGDIFMWKRNEIGD
jgi:2-polyprenyl-3-methyl-5-hydroxy-6-metoxy-1,4-benzoquinol methylase